MTDRPQTTGDGRSQDTTDGFRRREFVALGAGVSATMLAGCAGEGDPASSDGSDDSNGSNGSAGSDGSETLTGNFRLLISDAPADIADFDRLDVTLDRARIFETEGDDEEGEEDDSDAEEDSEDDEEEEDESDEGDRGFTVIDLDGATVDLTQVIEDDAMAVFDGEISAGSYEKIELSVSDVKGIVDGEAVDVKLPSEKLQITNGFEVTPDEPVSFVFDINVVKRGQNNGYILRPVISGSGVAGRDVDVNEIGGGDGDAEDETDESGDGATGNETDDAENGTAGGSDS